MPRQKSKQISATCIAPALLRWYDKNRRTMPWRAPPGVTPKPYYVWLSEIMLQQTTVATVGPYFKTFVTRWPSIKSLAGAKLNDVLAAWAGLGYYSRARNLHAAAKVIEKDYAGKLPTTLAQLEALPGVGRYTAAAIMAIAYDQPANVVDGNVERVMARLYAVKTPLPAAKKELSALAAPLVPAKRPGDYAQALMDLGATVCTPQNPRCEKCPLKKQCAAFAKGAPATYPKRQAKKKVPEKESAAYVLLAGNKVLLRQRPAKGLLASMFEVPNSGLQQAEVLQLPQQAKRWESIGEVQHVFSHFRLRLSVQRGQVLRANALPAPYFWVSVEKLAQQALPTVMQKVLQQAGLMPHKQKRK